MATQNLWQDYETLRHSVKQNTVDRLKSIITRLNDECGLSLVKSGKKQDLIDRVVHQLDSWHSMRSSDKWMVAKDILSQTRTNGHYSSPNRGFSVSAPYSVPSSSKASGYSAITSGTPSLHRYDPYAPPRPSNSTSASSPFQGTSGIKFKASPYYRIEQQVSGIAECPESQSATDRRTQLLNFQLSADHIAKLQTKKYQLRLYCTSSTFYSANPGFRSNSTACLIEFPPTCEVRVNTQQLTANLKGLKKKPGTAPPPDISKLVRHVGQNRVDIVYVNSQQPVQLKKYYIVVCLVEVTSVDELVDRLKKGKYRTCEEILAQMVQSANDDDDIIAGPQKMTLKCPLSYLRISTPCRSILCVHSQCFDAMSWFAIMEQTATFMCPVCEKVLNPDELIVDGYVDEILKQTPDSVEDVMVEADGEWHTTTNKYASAKWKMQHPPVALKVPPASRPVSSPPKSVASIVQPKAADIVILDTDDEDEGRVKRELSPSSGGSIQNLLTSRAAPTIRPPAPVPSRPKEAVIDLTLDSDDDGHPPPPTTKRKAPGPITEEPSWKRARLSPLVSHSSLDKAESPSTSGNRVEQNQHGLHNLPQTAPLPVRHPSANPTVNGGMAAVSSASAATWVSTPGVGSSHPADSVGGSASGRNWA